MVYKTIEEAEHCDHCGSRTKAETQGWFCDQCDSRMEWNRNNGFTHKIRLWHGADICDCGEPFPEMEFCSLSCLSEWLENDSEEWFAKHDLTSESATIQFTLHPLKLPEFLRSLDSTPIKEEN